MQARERLRTMRVEAREDLTREEYHLRRIEAFVALIDDEVETLERPTLTGLLASVLGTRQQKLEAKRNDRRAVQREVADVTAAIDDIEARLRDVEKQIESLGNPDAELLSLFESKERAILERDDEAAEQLRAVSRRLAAAREEARKTAVAIKTGTAVLERMRMLLRSLGRARKTGIARMHMAPLLATGWIVVKARGAKAHVSRVRDGLRRFHEQLTALETRSEAEHDLEIIRMAPMIEHVYTVELVGQWEQWALLSTVAGHPMERDVHALMGHLEERLKHCRQEADALEQEKRELVERL